MIFEKANTKFTIARFTTPTLTFKFGAFSVDRITNAKLNMNVRGERFVTKDFSAAEVDTDANTISWTLAQAESGTLPEGRTGEVYCSWLYDDGTRGRSKYSEFLVVAAGEEGVMADV